MKVWLGSPSSSAYFFQRRIGSRNVIAIYGEYRKDVNAFAESNSRPSIGQVSSDVIVRLKIENAWVRFCATARESKREIRNFLWFTRTTHFF